MDQAEVLRVQMDQGGTWAVCCCADPAGAWAGLAGPDPKKKLSVSLAGRRSGRESDRH